MNNNFYLVQVCDEANFVSTKIVTGNSGIAIKWCKFYVHDCKYEESWIVEANYNEIDFTFQAVEKMPCKYLLTQHGLRFNSL